ncbi:protein of unknown function DUF494 [Gemmatirosa kalamazoonensis]|uniref:Uncharacterized protein n=2 Tax=Gemmatirosa kalamazoonensis TaxID=861299 RepID=W0RK83_9BACT|nr:protein of unknown function DUF494 [Gemmatirosa kalamazoonensis]
MTMSDASLNNLLSEMRERFAPGADPREVEVWLASRGYDARQIGEILEVFAPHLSGVPTDGGTSRPPAGRRPEGPLFRVPGSHERGRFAPEAWGRILALSATGALSPADREGLIERALQSTDGRVGLAELRALLESAGIDDGGSTATTIH